jgi:hypothetical protein
VTLMHTGNSVFALKHLAELLDGCDAKWVVGGSTGLALRGAKLDTAPRDLDVYADRDAVRGIHERLASYAVDGPEDNETQRYRSVLSHYRIADTVVELVGDFRIAARGSTYITEVEQLLYPHGDIADAAGMKVRLVPLGHELIFNLLRDRMDRAEVAGNMIAANALRHWTTLRELIERNQLADDVAEQAMLLTHREWHANSGIGLAEEERT